MKHLLRNQKPISPLEGLLQIGGLVKEAVQEKHTEAVAFSKNAPAKVKAMLANLEAMQELELANMDNIVSGAVSLEQQRIEDEIHSSSKDGCNSQEFSLSFAEMDRMMGVKTNCYGKSISITPNRGRLA